MQGFKRLFDLPGQLPTNQLDVKECLRSAADKKIPKVIYFIDFRDK